MRNLLQDLRYTGRLFVGNPGFVAVALLSLGLGIGANTTIFTVINAVLLRSAPVKDPKRLAVLFETNARQGGTRVPTYTAFEQWKKRSQIFEAMTLADEGGSGPATLTSAKQAVRIRIGAAGQDFFSVVGVTPILGRTFLPEDAPPGPGLAMVLSYEFWQRWFGGDKNVLGQKVSADGMNMTIVGVMPPGFWLFPWGRDADAWYVFNPAVNPNSRWLVPIGRLRQGATLSQPGPK